MFDIEDLITSKDLEDNGVWKPIGHGAEIKVARIGNDAYLKMMRHGYKDERAVIDQEDDFSAEVQEKLLKKVYAHTILKDIRGITRKGVELKYTPELGLELLEIRDFREKVKAYAEEMQTFQVKAEKAAVED